MRVLLLTGVLTVLTAPGVCLAVSTKSGDASVLSLDDRLPTNLRPDVEDLQQQFKKNSCPVLWDQTGPVKYDARKRKTGRIPGWEVGTGKKATFVGYKDRRCDFGALRKRAGNKQAFDRAFDTIPQRYSKPVRQAQRGGQIGVAGFFVSFISLPVFISSPFLSSTERDVAVTLFSSTLVLSTLLTYTSLNAARKQAVIAHLKERKRAGREQRNTAETSVLSCFNEDLKRHSNNSAAASEAALDSCRDLVSRFSPEAWEYGLINNVSPAELAVRAKHQVKALNRAPGRHRTLSGCLKGTPSKENTLIESCRTDGNQAVPVGLKMAHTCRALLTELSALGPSGRKLYPLKDLRRAVEAQEKAVNVARKDGRKWREDKDAACARNRQKQKAKANHCRAKYSPDRTPITATFECKTTGIVKRRRMVNETINPLLAEMNAKGGLHWNDHRLDAYERGMDGRATELEVNGCRLVPDPPLPTACKAWHRLR